MRLRSLMILSVLIGPAMGAEPEAGSDLSKVQGRWEATVGKKREFSVALEVKGNDVSADISPKRGPKVKATGELQLDPSVSPALARLGQVLDPGRDRSPEAPLDLSARRRQVDRPERRLQRRPAQVVRGWWRGHLDRGDGLLPASLDRDRRDRRLQALRPWTASGEVTQRQEPERKARPGGLSRRPGVGLGESPRRPLRVGLVCEDDVRQRRPRRRRGRRRSRAGCRPADPARPGAWPASGASPRLARPSRMGNSTWLIQTPQDSGGRSARRTQPLEATADQGRLGSQDGHLDRLVGPGQDGQGGRTRHRQPASARPANRPARPSRRAPGRPAGCPTPGGRPP